ncbi:MAG: helix-turn-helix transcriptional regulator [Dehalococcoidia bacterium]|nr:helix-turn-helix transcriptional regulator [Dehalococcoidia bacterium]
MVQSAASVEGYRRSFEAMDDFSLTRREREILWHVAQGKGNKDIAMSLGISVCTVKVHISNIFFKLDVTRRDEAVNAARRLGELKQGLQIVPA